MTAFLFVLQLMPLHAVGCSSETLFLRVNDFELYLAFFKMYYCKDVQILRHRWFRRTPWIYEENVRVIFRAEAERRNIQATGPRSAPVNKETSPQVKHISPLKSASLY
jgi:hypothetical protein